MNDYRCPNCGASFSLPLEMTCDNHHPMPYCFTCANTGTIERDVAVGYVARTSCPDCQAGAA